MRLYRCHNNLFPYKQKTVSIILFHLELLIGLVDFGWYLLFFLLHHYYNQIQFVPVPQYWLKLYPAFGF